MGGKVIFLAEFRKTRKAQSRILKRLIERHLVEAGRISAPSSSKNLAVVRMQVAEDDEE